MNITSVSFLIKEPKMLFLVFQEWNDSLPVVGWFDFNFQESWHYHMIIALLRETPRASLKGQHFENLKIYFILVMAMLRISISLEMEMQGLMSFCLCFWKYCIHFSNCIFLCVLNKCLCTDQIPTCAGSFLYHILLILSNTALMWCHL